MAVADVFDALMSKRSYKPPFSYEDAVKIITDGSGTRFDPKVVAAFVAAIDEVKAVCEKFSSDETYMGAPQKEDGRLS